MRQHPAGSGWLVEELALSQTLKRLVELGQAEVEGGASGLGNKMDNSPRAGQGV